MPKLKQISAGLILSTHNRFTAVWGTVKSLPLFLLAVFSVSSSKTCGSPKPAGKAWSLPVFHSPSLSANAACWTTKTLQGALSASCVLNLCITGCLLQAHCCFAGVLLTSVWTSSHLVYIPSKQWCFQSNSQTLCLRKNCFAICWIWVNDN